MSNPTGDINLSIISAQLSPIPSIDRTQYRIFLEASCADFQISTKDILGDYALIWDESSTQKLGGGASSIMFSLRGRPYGNEPVVPLGSVTVDLMSIDFNTTTLHAFTLTGMVNGHIQPIGVLNIRIYYVNTQIQQRSLAPPPPTIPTTPFASATPESAPPPTAFYDTPQLRPQESLGPPKYEDHIEFQTLGGPSAGRIGAFPPPNEPKTGYDAPPSYDFYAPPVVASYPANEDINEQIVIPRKKYARTSHRADAPVDLRLILSYSPYIGFTHALRKQTPDGAYKDNSDSGLEFDVSHMHLVAQVYQPALTAYQKVEDRRVGVLDKPSYSERYAALPRSVCMFPHSRGAPHKVSVLYDDTLRCIRGIVIQFPQDVRRYGTLPLEDMELSMIARQDTFSVPMGHIIAGMNVHFDDELQCISGLSFVTSDNNRSKLFGRAGTRQEDHFFIDKATGQHCSLAYLDCYITGEKIVGLRVFHAQPILESEVVPRAITIDVDPQADLGERRNSTSLVHSHVAPSAAVARGFPAAVPDRVPKHNQSQLKELLYPSVVNSLQYLAIAVLSFLFASDIATTRDGGAICPGSTGIEQVLMASFGLHVAAGAICLVWLLTCTIVYCTVGKQRDGYAKYARRSFIWIYFLLIGILAIVAIVGLKVISQHKSPCLTTGSKVVMLVLFGLTLLNILTALIALVPTDGGSEYGFLFVFLVHYGIIIAGIIALIVICIFLAPSSRSGSRSGRRRRY